ncbi:UvrD-helicase domain-containing protein [Frigoribacterium sp. CFBP 8766]|uniref:3'-5' exonuclease n=1 Tax=Frigoribacterium sp. CFBP 8766 TaxID=2775273 RepID=UPI00177C5944|nr:3'-5' exonuclease [Frigoribacterium sp. CFBP 8766]MBD8584141.1 UvrD-helicase domain-containing protein [Frigoribacterium sp. CFBP 8766]
MPQIVMSKLKGQKHDKPVQAKIMTFLMKLAEDDTTLGLHIEPMQRSADARARTGRVDGSLRAVLYRLDPPNGEVTYVYGGTWQHDKAIEIARTRVLQINPINGIAEIIDAGAPEAGTTPVIPIVQLTEPQVASFLTSAGYLRSDLTDELGFDATTADLLMRARSNEDLLAFGEGLSNQWQVDAVLGLAVGDSVAKILTSLGVEQPPTEPVQSDDQRLKEALLHPAAKMQFTFIENNDELRRVVEGGDFGAWRVFLHPEQRTYATKPYSGPFRLSGGAGTGKTVVLLHRTREMWKEHPDARIVLTTFTTALSAALVRDLERLDPDIGVSSGLGDKGVLVRGVDALAAAVRSRAGAAFNEAAADVFGAPMEPRTTVVSNDRGWREAIDDADPATLPASVRTTSFFEGEYLQVILPNRITSRDQYFAVKRPGRGVALDRRKRAAVWAIVEQYRQTSRHLSTLSFAEVAAVACAYLDRQPHRIVDHVLIDEAQDLTPVHWQLLRALAQPGPNDLFIADDVHQRIYGYHVVLSRYGIKITGRSKRLTLNYRTTQQNLKYALGVLSGAAYVDSEENEESDATYRSARSGPHPRVLDAASPSAQFDGIAEEVKSWVTAEVRPETIAILARSNKQASDVKTQLADRGVELSLSHSGEPSTDKPVVMTMHKAKGMEFSRVILFDVSEGSIPNPMITKGVAPEELDDVYLRERSLLYVAASRARDELVVSWQGKPSELLN